MVETRLTVEICIYFAVGFTGFASSQSATNSNEGSILSPNSATGEFIYSWWGKHGRTYFLQHCDDLGTESWKYVPIIATGTDQMVSWELDSPGQRGFWRLRFSDIETNDPRTADFDRDGVNNFDELMQGTDPLVASVESAVYQSHLTVSVRDFGAVGDGVVDDSAAIQQAVSFAFASAKNVYFPSATYAIGTTIIIPQYMNYTMRGIRIDGGNSNFKLLSDTTLFTSGYENGGRLVTNFGTLDDSHYSAGITLENFQISSDVGILTAAALKIQDWHQGSALQNISSNLNAIVLNSHNNYYAKFDNIRSIGSGSGARFNFSGVCNLNMFSRLVAYGAEVGYNFTGSVASCQFVNNSIENVGVGLQFDSTVYNTVIANNFFQGFNDVAVKFNDYVASATLENNYVNFGNASARYFVDYLPLPLNNIVIESDNCFLYMPSEANIIKTLDSVYSAGVVFHRPKANALGLSDLLASDQLISSQSDWRQKIDMPGMRANVINRYVVGNYSGRYTSGHDTSHGFDWVSGTNSILKLQTRIVPSTTQRIYVNLDVSAFGGGSIVGEFIGSTFYQNCVTGVKVTSKLSVSAFDGYVQIEGKFMGPVTQCVGEVRLR